MISECQTLAPGSTQEKHIMHTRTFIMFTGLCLVQVSQDFIQSTLNSTNFQMIQPLLNNKIVFKNECKKTYSCIRWQCAKLSLRHPNTHLHTYSIQSRATASINKWSCWRLVKDTLAYSIKVWNTSQISSITSSVNMVFLQTATSCVYTLHILQVQKIVLISI